MELAELGFDDWFSVHGIRYAGEDGGVARVTAVDRGSFLVRNGSREIPAECSGRLSYQVEHPDDLPCVGDWVEVQYYDNERAAIIHGVLPRKSFLRRKTAGAKVDFQMIAANIDTAFIVQSCHFDFNLRRLERYLVMAAAGGVRAVVLLTKTDLVSREEAERNQALVARAAAGDVLAVSSVTGDGVDALRQRLAPARTYCFIGSSGVGKTTLINRLLGREAFDTKPVSGTGEGTHATSRRQLVLLDGGAMLIDTPGMRELGLLGSAAGIDKGFDDLGTLGVQCRYADCTHEHEPGCGVRAAIERGEVTEDRYANYRKLKKESEYHDLSYRDKRKKDRAFGRFVKSVKAVKKREKG